MNARPLRSSGPGLRLSLGFALLAGACGSPTAFEEPDLQAPARVAHVEVPESRAAVLAELAPLPWSGVIVDYDVAGPGGMTGSMTVWLAEGARRKEHWSLRLPMPEGDDATIVGAAIQTPDRSWTDAAEGSAVVEAQALGPLADAYLGLPLSQQAKILANVRGWHADLAQGRQAHPGEVEEVAGHSCLRSSVAGQSLCLWEATGLPLDFASEAFTMRARSVETDAVLDAGLFQIPDGAQPVADAAPLAEPEEALAKLAVGDLAELAVLLQPGLRLGS